MSELRVRADKGAVVFEVRVTPRARRESIVGVHDGALKVSLTAPPVDGAANQALVKVLSKALGVPKRAVTIVQGETARTKRVRVEGTTAELALRCLASSSEPPA